MGGEGGEGVESPTKFLKREGLAGSQFLEGGLLGKRAVTFFRGAGDGGGGGVQFLNKK